MCCLLCLLCSIFQKLSSVPRCNSTHLLAVEATIFLHMPCAMLIIYKILVACQVLANDYSSLARFSLTAGDPLDHSLSSSIYFQI